MRQIILAQRNQQPVVGAAEVEAFECRLVLLQLLLDGARRAILDEIGELLEERRRAPAREVGVLPEREDFLELIEDDERNQRASLGIGQRFSAVMQEFP